MYVISQRISWQSTRVDRRTTCERSLESRAAECERDDPQQLTYDVSMICQLHVDRSIHRNISGENSWFGSEQWSEPPLPREILSRVRAGRAAHERVRSGNGAREPEVRGGRSIGTGKTLTDDVTAGRRPVNGFSGGEVNRTYGDRVPSNLRRNPSSTAGIPPSYRRRRQLLLTETSELSLLLRCRSERRGIDFRSDFRPTSSFTRGRERSPRCDILSMWGSRFDDGPCDCPSILALAQPQSMSRYVY